MIRSSLLITALVLPITSGANAMTSGSDFQGDKTTLGSPVAATPPSVASTVKALRIAGPGGGKTNGGGGGRRPSPGKPGGSKPK